MVSKKKAAQPPSGDTAAVEQFLDLLARLIANEHLRRCADVASTETGEATISTNNSKPKKPEKTNVAKARKRR